MAACGHFRVRRWAVLIGREWAFSCPPVGTFSCPPTPGKEGFAKTSPWVSLNVAVASYRRRTRAVVLKKVDEPSLCRLQLEGTSSALVLP